MSPTDPLREFEMAMGGDNDHRSAWMLDHEDDLRTWVRASRLASPPAEPAFSMLAHLTRQREWSDRTFGPGERTAGVIDHIRKELREIEADPTDISEWIDVVILGLDGAWRSGYQPQQIIDALVAKQAKNEAREWPDWRTQPFNRAIEHVKAASPAVRAPQHQDTKDVVSRVETGATTRDDTIPAQSPTGEK